ncbi:hypothetical protein EOS_12355 [Caballeronia mineralivorans PML1(12)]|uniref:Uncharacterized protein n=1 Tax=Caballeronia mineralivorans PML1(12) TaxID=908627 RepID=A0A0J1CZE1_9BURK|nr:hypothetical protein EOS_12355 [Caballeronia mineralivorans PML1(12)]
MTIDELRVHLKHLIDTYVQDSAKQQQLLSLVARGDVPVKHILAEITPSLSAVIAADDQAILKDIVFYFC